MENKNFACRIFKEQIELILQLPENERAEVLYKSVLFGFNQIDCQFDNQNENQNESAYVSVSDSVSILSNKIFNLLKKNITWKEFSNNYGGNRKGAGAPKGNTNAKKNNQIENQNDIQIDNQNEKPKSKFNEDSIIYVNGQYFDEFPPESIPTLKKYWSVSALEEIRKDLAFKPDHTTTVAQMLLNYPPKPKKKSYGEQNKVKLSDDEYTKLKELYGEYMDTAIDLLDRYLATNNKKYASHYAVMRKGNWVYTQIMKIKLDDERGF